MRLGLLGYPVSHSLSPKLYQMILKDKLTSYDLFPFATEGEVPGLLYFQSKLDGLNITTPYKTHFIRDVLIDSPIVKELGAINTISFTPHGIFATNTDAVAVEEILTNYQKQYPHLHLILLGGGVMAKVTLLVARKLGIKVTQLTRHSVQDLVTIDINKYRDPAAQNLIINACSRNFTFQGIGNLNDIFWDYNYSFLPHQNSLPSRFKSYQDGQEMLELQARAAVKFWSETNPKLK